MSVELPHKMIDGTTSTICISDLMRPRDPYYEHIFHPGQEQLGGYYLAPFQRPAVWSTEQSARLIESVFLGISIGSFVVSATGMHEGKDRLLPRTSEWIIDGQQRMRALMRYLANDLEVFVGTEHQHRWEDLNLVQKRVFLLSPVGFITLGSQSEESLREVYDRLNFGGVAHTEDQRAVKI